MKTVETQLKSLQNRLNQMGRSFVRVGTLGLFGGGGMGVLTGLRNIFVAQKVTEAVAWPIKLAAGLEMASAQLGTFTSNEQVARDMLIDLQKFSAFSIVGADNLAAAAGMMLRFGVAEEQVALHTKGLAVLAAGNSEEFDKLALAFAQVASAGKLQGEEMRQFKNTAFNPLREIAERTGESMDQVRMRMEAGKISFQEVANALQAAVGPGGRFHHLIERISNTFSGQWSKAIAQVKLGLIPIGDQFLGTLTKMLKAVNGVLPVILENLNSFITTSINNFKMLHPGFMQAFDAITNAMMSGKLSLAADVMFTSLKIAWLNGTQELRQVWSNFASAAVKDLIDFGFSAQEQWQKIVGGIELSIQSVGAKLKNAGATIKAGFQDLNSSLRAEAIRKEIDPLEARLKEFEARRDSLLAKQKSGGATRIFEIGDQEELHNLDVAIEKIRGALGALMRQELQELQHRAGVANEYSNTLQSINRAEQFGTDEILARRGAALDQLEANSQLAQEIAGNRFSEESRAAAEALADAQHRLDALRRTAAVAAESIVENFDFGLGKQFADLAKAGGGLDKAKDTFRQPEAFFDTRLARQMLSGPQEQSLAELRKIERNTRNIGNGGLPVV